MAEGNRFILVGDDDRMDVGLNTVKVRIVREFVGPLVFGTHDAEVASAGVQIRCPPTNTEMLGNTGGTL